MLVQFQGEDFTVGKLGGEEVHRRRVGPGGLQVREPFIPGHAHRKGTLQNEDVTAFQTGIGWDQADVYALEQILYAFPFRWRSPIITDR